MLRKTLDTMLDANLESIKEQKYECYHCEGEFDSDDMDVRHVESKHWDGKDQVLVCHRCIRLGFDEWNR